LLFLHESHRLEILGDRLISLLQAPGTDPLIPRIVIPQNPVIGRWLTFRMADTAGICSNLSFPLAGRFIREMLEKIYGISSRPAHFDKQTLLFRIFEILSRLALAPAFFPVRSFTGDPPEESRLYDLSLVLSDLYDRSMIYRPDLFLDWEGGKGEDYWPAILWRKLAGEGDAPEHRARLMERFFRDGSGRVAAYLPPRLFLFGLTGLPPQDLLFFRTLGESTEKEVHLFFLNPCQEYWGDIVSPAQKGRKSGPISVYFDVGHPLLSAWGEHFRTLHHSLSDAENTFRDFPDIEKKTLLGHLQSDIRTLRNRGEEVRSGGRKETVPVSDRSIEIVACTGQVREIEMLKDRLLGLFSEDPSLKPEDIVVLAPDISVYSGAIRSVFGGMDRGGPKGLSDPSLPFTVSDQRDLEEEELFLSLLTLLRLPRERFTAPVFLRLLSVAPIARKFALEEVRSSRLREILVASGMRWGRNGSDRPPPYAGREEHTFREGLDRLVLGYACGDGPFDPSLDLSPGPVALNRDESGEVSGGLSVFLDALDALHESLSDPLPLGLWPERLHGILESFFDLDPENRIDREILSLPEKLSAILGPSGVSTPVSSSLIAIHLRRIAGTTGGRDRFFSGGVTFGQMVPLRSIPFRVVCLLGMNDAAFPRTYWPPSFDWMAESPRPGDRSVREDDRMLFLEALMSARDSLWISYEGRDVRDGTRKEPSVLVRQLLDTVSEGFEGEHGPIGDQILLTAPLDPLSPEHFEEGGDARLKSFSREWLEALVSEKDSASRAPVFFSRELRWKKPGETGSGDGPDAISLCDLLFFFRNPVKYFLTREMGLSSGGEGIILEEDEPFLPEEQKLLAAASGEGPPDSRDLPWPPLREIVRRRVEKKVEEHDLARSSLISRELGEERREIRVRVDLLSGGARLFGVIDHVLEGEGQSVLLLDHWPRTLYPSYFLQSFLLHLVMGLVRPDSRKTLLIGKSGTSPPKKGARPSLPEVWGWNSFGIQTSRKLLNRYLKAYRAGLFRPLLFDPVFSRTCAETALAQEGISPIERRSRALEKAAFDWKKDLENHFLPKGASSDPRRRTAYWSTLAFSGRNPMEEPDFYRWSLLLWKPLLQSRFLYPETPFGTSFREDA